MKTKNIVKGFIALLLLTITFSGCESYTDELLDGIGASREFSPIGLTTKIRNQTTVELNWTTREDADHYVVEFSADDTEFKTIYKTVNVTAAQLPVQVQLEGETVYSIRIKAVSANGIADSKWSVTTATTLTEQLFIAAVDGDIDAKEATLRWVANSAATQIVVNPGNITHVLTAEEKLVGIAKVTGLTGETDYTATLYNGTKKRGITTFKTGIDIGTGILIRPEDDLAAKIAEADANATLVLMPGTYDVTATDIVLNKPITIRGLRSYDKPKINNTFSVGAGATSVSFIDLDLDGTGITNAALMTITGVGVSYGDILVSGCTIHDYTRALIYGNTLGTKVKSFTIDNSYVKNVNTNVGADFIDFRNTYVADIVVKNSTFNTCSVNRDFVRVDAASGLNGTGLTTNVLIDSCTLYKVSDISVAAGTAGKRILYVRFNDNASIVRNTLITETSALYTNQPLTKAPTYTKNYYYNAAGFMDTTIASNKVDASGTVANPQFVNPAGDDFTIKNGNLLDEKVGDPRWIK